MKIPTPDSHMDWITRAVRREREARQRFTPECDSIYLHGFKCVVCDRWRDDQHRREPYSEVCRICSHHAGYDF